MSLWCHSVYLPCNSIPTCRSEIDWNLRLGNTSTTYYMGYLVPQMSVSWVYRVDFLHSLSNQGHFGLQISTLRLVTLPTQLVATWLLGINLICSYLASDQAERQGPWDPFYIRYGDVASHSLSLAKGTKNLCFVGNYLLDIKYFRHLNI